MSGFIPNLALEASAGSGKTFSLVVRYLSLLFMDVHPKAILALTFTNKAANEMQERVIKTLTHLEQSDELIHIAETTMLSQEAILAKKEMVLTQFLRADIKIMTLDKFFAKILKKFALHLGLTPNINTQESQHEIKLLITFLTQVKKAKKERNLLHVASLMSRRFSDIFTLLNHFYQYERDIKALHFGQGDLNMAKDAVFAALGKLDQYVQNHKGASATAKKSFSDESIEALLKRKWLERETLEYRTFSKCYSIEMDNYFFELKAALKGYIEIKESNLFSEILELLELYKDSKMVLAKESFELSFDDITQLVYELLHNRIDSDFLYFRLDAKVEHLLLDEFQDTSVIQYEILRPIIEELTSGVGVHEKRSFFFVGDVKQSIYRFRGGVSALFSHVLTRHNVTLEKLNVNYRSSKEVVHFVNTLFQEAIEGYTPQLAYSSSGGYVEVSESEALLDSMIKKVKALLEMGADGNNIAILCATNGDGETIESLLKAEGVEVVTETSAKLINQRSVKAIIEYLKFIYFNEPIYKANFFALLGCETFVLDAVEIKGLHLLLHVKQIINRYQLFDGDLNIIRFLEILATFRDIEQFIYEYERIGEAASQMELHGVRVMTVHKSKGLEFEYVIVLDRLKKRPPERSTLIFEYSDITLQALYLRTQGRKYFDSAYAKALDKEQVLLRHDRINALYVAFTRAREALFVLKNAKDSEFDILTLDEGRYGSLHVKSSKCNTQSPSSTLQYSERAYGLQKELLTPSDESTSEEGEDSNAILFGLALHYTLEMMDGYHLDSLDSALGASYHKYGYALGSEAFEDMKQRITLLCQNSQFLALIEGTIYKEQPLSFKGELKYLDAMIENSSGYVVIDYKSSKKFSQHHHSQVRNYMYALKSITKREVRGVICYLLEDQIELKEV